MLNVEMKVLLDNDVLNKAEMVVSASRKKDIKWGDINEVHDESGFIKKMPDTLQRQTEIDALYTIGRLIREGKLLAYTYNELDFESFRRPIRLKPFNALNGCKISNCPSPVERSKFRKTINFDEHVSKGGKKDRKKGSGEICDFNQIPFISWLLSLENSHVERLLAQSSNIGLSEFEVESLKELDWFKFVCNRFDTPENYPDAFHIWAAERNSIDIFLTMETKLVNTVNSINNMKNGKYRVNTLVCNPSKLLEHIGVSELDEIPIKEGKFYPIYEL